MPESVGTRTVSPSIRNWTDEMATAHECERVRHYRCRWSLRLRRTGEREGDLVARYGDRPPRSRARRQEEQQAGRRPASHGVSSGGSERRGRTTVNVVGPPEELFASLVPPNSRAFSKPIASPWPMPPLSPFLLWFAFYHG